MEIDAAIRPVGNRGASWHVEIRGTEFSAEAMTIPGALRKLATSLEEEASLQVEAMLKERRRGGPKNEG